MMSITYEVIEEFGNKIIKATNGDDVYFIPTDRSNADYQAYLKTLNEANTL